MNARLKCPACAGAIDANPLGRWFARFKCPHCAAPLRFDATTNVLGVLGAIAFVGTAIYASMQGEATFHDRWIQIGIGAWIMLVALSYFARGVERDKRRG